MSTVRYALFGAGFWSQYQMAGWQELEGAECVAIYNRTLSRAEGLAERFDVPRVYDDPQALLRSERLDFVDIVTSVETHAPLVEMVAARGLPVICQKPLATSLDEAERMVATCRQGDVPLYVHENWRWQHPIREFKRALDVGHIGKPFRGTIMYNSSFPVFDNQPFLKELEQFILTDIGSHILDVARFLFGEATTLYALTERSRDDIRGEDVATVMMRMGRGHLAPEGLTVVCQMSYASRLEHERFPETYITVEGTEGSLELGPDYWLRETTADGTHARRVPPPFYAWADPRYALIHASIVPTNANLLAAIRGEQPAETTGEDNLETVRLVYGAYDSAARSASIQIH